MRKCLKCGQTTSTTMRKNMCCKCYTKDYREKNHKYSDRHYAYENINFTYFDSDTPSVSYFLGLIHSDGYLVDVKSRKGDKCQNKVGISMVDKDMVQLLSKELNAEFLYRTIRENDKYKNSQGFLEISSDELYNSLSRRNIDNLKTYYQKVPNTNYIWHYLRGLFDGDGGISKKDFKWNLTVSGDSMRDWLITLFNQEDIEYQFICTKYRNDTITLYRFFGKGGLKSYIRFLDKLYNDCGIYRLNRKYELYLKAKDKLSTKRTHPNKDDNIV